MGRWISLSYDASNRVTQATDNIGQTVGYGYDANGNLSTVTDPENNLTRYTHDAANRLATITDGPMLIHGLQGFHGAALLVPGRRASQPDRSLLEERYSRFRRVAG